jgi:hypothetical protein
MNKSRYRKCLAVSLFLAFATTQLYLQVGLAGTSKASSSAAHQQGPTGILTTRGNKPVSVNGASATTSTTILSGSTIDTPAGVGATITFGANGRIDLAPNSSVRIDFSNGVITITFLKGCGILTTSKGTGGVVLGPQGAKLATIDPATGGSADACLPDNGGAPVVNTGAAGAAGAGAGTVSGGAAGAAASAGAGAGGISTTTGVVIGGIGIGAFTTLALVLPCRRGPTPSPFVPGQAAPCQ